MNAIFLNTFKTDDFIKFLLILFRCSGFFILTPVFGRREFPVQGKIGLAALLSLLLYPIVKNVDHYEHWWKLLIIVIKETTVGLTMGYISLLMFSALYLAGQIIDMQIGFGIVNVIDPQSSAQVPLMGNFYYMLTLVVFMAVNGHHVLISAMFQSYEIVPLGQAIFQDDFLNSIILGFINMFIIGVKVSLPIISIVLLTDMALGVIARTVPQMNVFILGIPIKIVAGITGMILILPVYLIAMDIIFNEINKGIFIILQGMFK